MSAMIKIVQAGLMAAVVLTASCKKGDSGPAGATGPAGTANVMYSSWMPTNPWTASTTSTGTGKNTFYFDVSTTQITQDILDKGTVIVYAKFIGDPDANGSVKQLPSIYYNLGGSATEYRFQTSLMLNKLRIICDVLPAGAPSTSNQIRYVIIPGGTTLRTQASPAMSYEEVCQLYHIPE